MALPESKLTKEQTMINVRRFMDGDVEKRITVTVRHDDRCGNGHNTFSITADIDERSECGRWVRELGVIMLDDVAKHFPKLKPLTKWHLMSTTGPMHYLANTMYQAGDRDHLGFRKGEVRRSTTHVTFDLVPVKHKVGKKFGEFLKARESQGRLIVVEVPHKRDPSGFGPNYTFEGFEVEWHVAPFRTEQEAELFAHAMNTCDVSFVEVATAWGEGKEPNLAAARSTAIWPNASLEQLQNKRTLLLRLPVLMVWFKREVESLGLEY